MKEPTEIRVVTIKGLCDILNCDRIDYYRKYKDRLKRYPTGNRSVLFLERDVLQLKNEVDNNIIKINQENLKVVC